MPLLLLDDELLRLISDTLRFSLDSRDFGSYAPQDRPQNEHLKRLSATCSRLRAITLPILFQSVSNQSVRTGCHEVSALWPHVQNLYIYGRNPAALPETFASVLPNLIKLRRLSIVKLVVPPKALILSLSSLSPTLDCLEFQETRLDRWRLTGSFSQLTPVSSLIMTASPRHKKGSAPANREDDALDLQVLETNITEILGRVAPTLVHLQISGDFVTFEMLASIKWPCLRTLKLDNHLPNGKIVPLPVVVSQMPQLSILALDFRADSEEYMPVSFCMDVCGPTLCTVLPNLEALSVSNCHPNDGIITQLPQGLRSLRVWALRDHPDFLDQFRSVPLNEVQACRWIEAASRLAYLAELALTLDKPQSRELLELIANACPKLERLELEQDRFENNNNDEEPMTYESFVEPLQSLTKLRHLRLTIEMGRHNRPRKYSRPPGNEHRFPVVCRFFAERLFSLKTIGLLFHNPLEKPGFFMPLEIRDRSSVWYTATIHRGREGDVPSVEFWKYA